MSKSSLYPAGSQTSPHRASIWEGDRPKNHKREEVELWGAKGQNDSSCLEEVTSEVDLHNHLWKGTNGEAAQQVVQ